MVLSWLPWHGFCLLWHGVCCCGVGLSWLPQCGFVLAAVLGHCSMVFVFGARALSVVPQHCLWCHGIVLVAVVLCLVAAAWCLVVLRQIFWSENC